MDDFVEMMVVVECSAATGHGPPYDAKLMSEIRREVVQRVYGRLF
jgi:hypothetical protein